MGSLRCISCEIIAGTLCVTALILCVSGEPDILDLAIIRLSESVPLCEKLGAPIEGVILE